MILISTTCRSRMLGPDFGSNHGSFSDVAGVSFRIEKSAPLRIMRSAPKHREIGFQETAGFGKTAGCLKNQGFWACRDLPEIRIWERNSPRNVLGPLLSDLGPLHVYRFDISQGSRFARKQGGSHEKERLQRAL